MKEKIREVIVVEGRYDKNALLQVVDATVVETGGFGVFNDKEKLAFFRRLAESRGLILLTDSDGAGGLIRSHLSGILPKDRLINLYIPKIEGKEKRKSEPSKEGFLGVEGMEKRLLSELLSPFSDENALARIEENRLSKTDFYIDGLSGGKNSASRRDEVAAVFSLPSGMTANALLSALKIVCTYEEYLAAAGRQGSQSEETE